MTLKKSKPQYKKRRKQTKRKQKKRKSKAKKRKRKITRKLKLKGDMGLAMKLGPLLSGLGGTSKL